METKLLLLKAISLVYYASFAKESGLPYYEGLVDKVLGYVEIPENLSMVDREHSIVVKLRSLALWVSKIPAGTMLPHAELMNRIRIACGDNDRVFGLYSTSLLVIDDEEPAVDRAKELVKELTQFVAIEDMVNLLRQSSRRISFERDKIEDVSTWRTELCTRLQDLPLEGQRRVSSISRCVNLADLDDVAEVFEIAEKATDPRGMLSTHLKALNRMVAQGPHQGIRRGDYFNVSAAPNNNKSGTLIDIFVAMCLFNKPCFFTTAVKALHVFISIEDPIEVVFQKIYIILKQIETELPVKTEGISYRYMAEYVNERLRSNGFEVAIMQFPRNGRVDDLIADLRQFIDDGYEIHSVGLDYPYLLGNEGIPAIVAGDEVPNKISHIRGWCNPKLIAVYAAHQLSTEGRALARMYPIEYIQQLSGKGYFEGSKKTDNPFDISIFVAKAVVNDKVYMQFQWDKRRGIGATPEAHKYFAVEFQPQPMYGLPYDADKDYDVSFAKIGARKANGEAGGEWDDFQ